MRPLLLLLLAAASAVAQPVSFGVRAGVPLTDFFSAVQNQLAIQGASFSFSANAKKYIVGPTIEVRLPLGLAIEFDALYRRLDYTGNLRTIFESISGNEFEFPLLVKYRFPSKFIRPFVDAGFTFNTLSGLKQSIGSATGLFSIAPATTNSAKGFVMGGGLDIKLKILHISPEIRYTHWGSTSFLDPLELVNGSQNQAEFLVGITF